MILGLWRTLLLNTNANGRLFGPVTVKGGT